MGAVEIIQKTGGQGLDPRFWMVLAILITLYSGLRIFRLTPRANLGSVKTSAALNEMMGRLQANGLTVYYEPNRNKNGDGFVVVGRAGIYVMEVKTGGVFGSRTIEHRAENELIFGGRISDSRPLHQAREAANLIRAKLSAVLQTETVVKPIVVFLDDWQVDRFNADPEVAVFTAAEAGQYFGSQRPILSQSQVDAISAHLAL